jgi:hypothetical protein
MCGCRRCLRGKLSRRAHSAEDSARPRLAVVLTTESGIPRMNGSSKRKTAQTGIPPSIPGRVLRDFSGAAQDSAKPVALLITAINLCESRASGDSAYNQDPRARDRARQAVDEPPAPQERTK